MDGSRARCSIDDILTTARARLDRVAPEDLEREQRDGACTIRHAQRRMQRTGDQTGDRRAKDRRQKRFRIGEDDRHNLAAT